MSNKQKKNYSIGSVEDFIEEIKKTKRYFAAYRGLADASWEVKASLCRTIRQDTHQLVYQKKIENMINEAKLKGFHQSNHRELSDLELLAQLQHNGAATCLIDFTYNSLIALWFACEYKKYKDGKVIIMPTDDPEKFSSIIYKDFQKNIFEFLKEDKWYKWTPTQLGNRIIAQQSLFIFGKRRLNNDDYTSIIIDKDKKEQIKEDLRDWFGISEETLFNDFTGFALSKAHNRGDKNNNASDYFRWGLQHQQQRKYQEAIQCYDTAIDIDPQYFIAYVNRGLAKIELDKNEEAITDCDKAIEINPQSTEAYSNRAVAKIQLGKYLEAIIDCDKAIELDAKNANLYSNRGLAKIELDKNEEAIIDCDKAIELNPQLAEAYFNRGVAKGKLNRCEEAITDFNKAIKINPRDANTYSNRGLAKIELGKNEEAIIDCDKAIELDVKNANAYSNRGLVKIRLGKNEEAIIDCDKAIELDVKNANAYSNRGLVKIRLGKNLEAIIDYDRAIELNPQLAEAYFNRGVAKKTLGLTDDEAQNDFDKAIELDPKLSEVYPLFGGSAPYFTHC